jgi:hypothetical protein
MTREIVTFEPEPASFIVSNHAPRFRQGREWRAVHRSARCTEGHAIDIYDADGSSVDGVICPVCCPEAYEPEPEPPPGPRQPLSGVDRAGLFNLLYAWADKHKDDEGETGIEACFTLSRLDAIRDRNS